uniref:Intraflagellar transport 27 homolog (Chlamydomonas) n=1 Tax=Oryzias latipes TaxID=8090 RepID=A0A3P9J138_ORYLA
MSSFLVFLSVCEGDAAVGKSSLICSDGTLKNYSMTTGVELVVKCINIPETPHSVEFYIFDSAGKEALVEACEKLWGEPSLFCLVFDLTNEQSFVNCGRWLERIRQHCRGFRVPGVLLGNKSDLSGRREVQASVAKEWAQSQGLEYHETSAKEMDSSDAPLLSLARAYYSLYQEHCVAAKNLTLG